MVETIFVLSLAILITVLCSILAIIMTAYTIKHRTQN